VGAKASVVAKIPAVRAALLNFQRDFATKPPEGKAGAVLDGRDVGTVVVPEAPVKLFVTASDEVRAQRRTEELRQKGESSIYTRVLADLRERDARDAGRADAPMRKADDAVEIDTSDLTVDQVLQAALSVIAEKQG
jgi:cytidylate kinase